MAQNRQDERTAPTRQAGWTPLHETGAVPAPTDAEDGTVAHTGTTLAAVTAGDAAVLATDRRASLGGRFVTSKRVRKVEQVHPNAAVALSGAVGHIQHFTRTLRAEASLYADRRGEEMSLDALATLAGNVLRSAPLMVTPILGGVGEDGPAVYSLDGGGGVLGDDYAAGGSGMQVAYGVLERLYDDDLSVEEGRAVAGRAIDGASERDTASGNGLAVATVSEEGVDVDEYAAVEEVA